MLVSEVVALLDECGIQTEESTSDAVLAVLRLHLEHAKVKAEHSEERRKRIGLEVVQLSVQGHITKAEIDVATARALSDETYLDELRMRPQVPPGEAPVDLSSPSPPPPVAEHQVGPSRWNHLTQAWERIPGEVEITRNRG